jgi:acyl-CoA oxidase
LWPKPDFSVQKMSKFITPDNREKRDGLRELLSTKLFEPQYNVSLDAERQGAYDKLKTICEEGFISVRDFDNNPLWIFAAHDMVAPICGSTATKMTVQFNLFGGTLLSIGTEKHHKMMDDIDNFSKVGCFGLSELGYGNNAVKMETRIDYNPADECFTINTPHPMAQKYWITNGAEHAHYCLVFGDLRIRGHDDTFGVHGVLVPIRDLTTHEAMPGVTVEDMGHKMGLNGIDNAKLSFDNVKVPRENLLDRFAQVDADGTYRTEVKGAVRSRFLKTADQLLSGRLCIASMSQGVAKAMLAMTVEYSTSRLSAGPLGESTAPIMAFQLQQEAILPLLAKTVACEIALYKTKTAWAMNRKDEPIVSNHLLIAYCCAIKAYTGWHVNVLANKLRERCGGQGFLSANRFGQGIAGTHSSITAEGDCSVLMMKVMMELANEMKTDKKWQQKVGREVVLENLKWLKAPIKWANAGKIDDISGLMKLMESRMALSIGESGLAMRHTDKDKKYVFANNNSQGTDPDAQERKRRVNYHKTVSENQHLIQAGANAWTEFFIAEAFQEAIEEETDADLKRVLNEMLELYILDCIKKDLGTFVCKHASINQDHLNKRYNALCQSLTKNVVGICDAFGYTKEMMNAPIANDWVKYNAVNNQGEITGIEY